MTIEEKAERYDKAFGIARNVWRFSSNNAEIMRMEELFPELKESEDDRIRKELHIYLDWLDGRKDYAPRGEYSIKAMIAWLEKQKEYESNADVEYTRTDAFIEKAWDWIENNILSPNQQDESFLYYEQFKNDMKGESGYDKKGYDKGSILF